MKRLLPKLSPVYKNSALNIVSQLLIMVIMFVAIPFVVRGLGELSFSILSLIWTVIAYFALWDLGIGRAVTKFVAEKNAAGKKNEVITIIYNSVITSIILGIILGLLLLAFETKLSSWLFTVPAQYVSVVHISLRLVAFGMPILVLQGALRGALMGFSRFDITNVLQVGNGILQWGGALVLVLLRFNVVSIIGFVILLRVLTTVLYFVFLRGIVDFSLKVQFGDRKLMRSLLGFGGWAMVSQVTTPVLQYTERFMLSSLIATSVVAFYVVPYEATSKMLVLSIGMVSALFPAFSEMQGRSGGDGELGRLYKRSERILILSFLPLGVVLVTLAPELLKVWMGAEFASRSVLVFQILAAAFVLNAVSLMPFTHLQAIGRTDITGKIHLSELPVHLVLTYALVTVFGLLGAAVATLIRITADSALLYYFSSKKLSALVPKWSSGIGDVIAAALLAVVGAGAIMFITSNPVGKLLLILAWLSVYGVVVFKYILESEEKESIYRLLSWRNTAA